MNDKDTLFANKVLELGFIDKQRLKNCYAIQQQSMQKGITLTLSQVTVKLGFITPQQLITIGKILQKQTSQNSAMLMNPTNPTSHFENKQVSGITTYDNASPLRNTSHDITIADSNIANDNDGFSDSLEANNSALPMSSIENEQVSGITTYDNASPLRNTSHDITIADSNIANDNDGFGHSLEVNNSALPMSSIENKQVSGITTYDNASLLRNTNHDITRVDSNIASDNAHFGGGSEINNSALFTSSMIGHGKRELMKPKECFNHYIIEEKLGAGGMGAVYRIRDERLGRSVALKVILGSGALTEKQVQRFLKEARATASLKHPNIVEVYEIGSHPQNYFTMELIKGRSLSYLIRSKNFTPRKAAIIMSKCSKAIHYAHEQGIVHRDIKPSNIMMENNQEPKIMDFGLAKKLEEEQPLSKTGDVLGTLTYMSPEQANGKNVDARSDIYSLGASLYEILSKRPPFQGGSSMKLMCQIFTEDPIELSLLNPDIPKDLEAICLKCLHKKPEKRYANAKELAKDLENFIHNRPVNAQPITNLVRIKKSIVRNKMLTFLIVFILTSLSAIAFLAERGRRFAQKQQQEAEKAKKTAITAQQKTEKEKQKAQKEQQKAKEAEEIAKKLKIEAEESLYKANLIIANIRNEKRQILTVNNVLERTLKKFPDAEYLWEYQWQKNRSHHELPHFISNIMPELNIKEARVSNNNLIVINHNEGASFFNLNKKSKGRLLIPTSYGTRACAISPDGSHIVVGDVLGKIFTWNSNTWKKTVFSVAAELSAHLKEKAKFQQQINDMCFSKNGSKILIARQTIDQINFFDKTNLQSLSYTKSLILVDIKSRKTLAAFSIPQEHLQGQMVKVKRSKNIKFINADFTCCDIADNGKIIIGGAQNKYLYAFHSKKMRFFGPHETFIKQCKIHPVHKNIVISSSARKLYFWQQNLWKDTQSNQQNSNNSLVKTITFKSLITDFDISPDGKEIIIATQNGSIHLWNINIKNTKKAVLTIDRGKDIPLTGHTKLNSCMFVNNGKNIVSGGNNIKLWNTDISSKPIRKNLNNFTRFCIFHPDSQKVVVGQLSSLALFDSTTGKNITRNGRDRLTGHFSLITHAAFNKMGILYTCGFDKSVSVWDLEKFERRQTKFVGNAGIERFAIVNNDKRIIAVGKKGWIYDLELDGDGAIISNSAHKIKDMIKNTKYFYAKSKQDLVNISWNGRDLVAVTGRNKWLYLINSKTLKLKKAININAEDRKCLLQYDEQTNSDYIFLTDKEHITKYKIIGDKLKPLVHFSDHTRKVLHLTTNPKTGQMISCGEDGFLYLWPRLEQNMYKNRNKDEAITLNSYFSFSTEGVFYGCSFDAKGNKIAANGADNVNHSQKNYPFFGIWDASGTK
ncbi:WD40 repeat domain-containing serine/threonine-protein kinase [Candidatus Uabimicrobium sp. HlEnr_7]|uniref:WD40 repeat domain-containing serine/threonine-protein kinase n=1 Tax=Candidatus Uabimicrobium helgolandensis TaxID=3095367 RepID=UPI003556FE01